MIFPLVNWQTLVAKGRLRAAGIENFQHYDGVPHDFAADHPLAPRQHQVGMDGVLRPHRLYLTLQGRELQSR